MMAECGGSFPAEAWIWIVVAIVAAVVAVFAASRRGDGASRPFAAGNSGGPSLTKAHQFELIRKRQEFWQDVVFPLLAIFFPAILLIGLFLILIFVAAAR